MSNDHEPPPPSHHNKHHQQAAGHHAANGPVRHTEVLIAVRRVLADRPAGERFVETDIMAEVFDLLALTYEQQSEVTANMIRFALTELADTEGVVDELPHHQRLAWLDTHRPQLPPRTNVWRVIPTA